MGRFLTAAVLFLAPAALASPALAADPAQGAKVFAAQCSICHGNRANSPPGIGPHLFGVVGRKAGTLPGYSYSRAMREFGKTWTPQELRLYLENPSATVHGNKMPYAGLHKPAQLDDLIAYLATLR